MVLRGVVSLPVLLGTFGRGPGGVRFDGVAVCFPFGRRQLRMRLVRALGRRFVFGHRGPVTAPDTRPVDYPRGRP